MRSIIGALSTGVIALAVACAGPGELPTPKFPTDFPIRPSTPEQTFTPPPSTGQGEQQPVKSPAPMESDGAERLPEIAATTEIPLISDEVPEGIVTSIIARGSFFFVRSQPSRASACRAAELLTIRFNRLGDLPGNTIAFLRSRSNRHHYSPIVSMGGLQDIPPRQHPAPSGAACQARWRCLRFRCRIVQALNSILQRSLRGGTMMDATMFAHRGPVQLEGLVPGDVAIFEKEDARHDLGGHRSQA